MNTDSRYDHLKLSEATQTDEVGEGNPTPSPSASTFEGPPVVSDDLIAYLDKYYPAESPLFLETFEELRWRGGARSVVVHLRSLHAEQTKRS